MPFAIRITLGAYSSGYRPSDLRTASRGIFGGPVTTLFVSNLSCWTKHLSNVSFLSPAILSQVLPSSLCLAYTTIPPTSQPSTSQTELLPCCSLLRLSLTTYLQICLFLWTSIIPDFPSLSSPQRKHLCSLSTIRHGSTLIASLLVALTDGLSVVLFFPSYIRLGTRFNPFLHVG